MPLPRKLSWYLFLFAALVVAVLWRDSAFTLEHWIYLRDWLFGNNLPWSLIAVGVNLAFILAISYGCRYLYRLRKFRLLSREQGEGQRNAVLVSDLPVTDLAHDGLSRTQFAQDVGQLLDTGGQSASSVVAITGNWGDGKTSALNFVRQGLLARNPRLIVVDFDPWPEDSKRGTVSRLLDEIAAQIGASNDVHPSVRIQTTRLLRSLADGVAQDLGTGIGALLRSAFRTVLPSAAGAPTEALTSLQADRASLQMVMERIDQGLIVIIDDLDRVDAEQLRSTLMAVHALSRLPNTSFLLSYDASVVDSQLKSLGLGGDQSPFRDKIVQVSIPLPPGPFVDRVRLLRESLTQILKARSIPQGWDFWDQTTRSQAETLAVRFCRSPRGLKRLANHTGLLIGRLGQEVNAADVLVLEVIRAEFPACWEQIRANRNNLDRVESYEEGIAIDIAEESLTNILSTVNSPRTKPLSATQRIVQSALPNRSADLAQMIMFLFPDGTSTNGSTRSTLEAQSRVAVGRNLRKYFSQGVEGMTIAEKDVRALLNSPEERTSILANALATGTLSSLMALARSHAQSNAPILGPDHLIAALLEATEKSWHERKEDVTENAAQLLLCAVERQPESQRFTLLKFILSHPTTLNTGHDVIIELLKRAQWWQKGKLRVEQGALNRTSVSQLVTNDELLQLKDLWVETVWQTGLSAMFENEPVPIKIIFRVTQLGGAGNELSRARKWMREFLQQEKNVAALVSQYSSATGGADRAVDGLETLIEDWPDFVEKVRKLDGPQDAIDKILSSNPPK